MKISCLKILGAILLLISQSTLALEKPEYEILHKDGRIEYRMYEPYVVAETKVEIESSYNRASNQGFGRLFRYITGNNISDSDIAMTAPVQMAMASTGEEIAMTTPVQSSKTGNVLQVAFMLPSTFSIDIAPLPLDENVELRLVPGRLMAVVRYSGRWTESNREKYESQLREAVTRDGIEILSTAESAAYNPPFTPPFMRRNEIMLEVSTFPQTES